MRPATLPAENALCRNNVRSISGASARCSARTNSVSRITASSAQPRRAGDVAPHAYPSWSTATNAVSAGAIKCALPVETAVSGQVLGGRKHEPAQDRAGESDRDVDPEHPSPVQQVQNEAAEGRAGA